MEWYPVYYNGIETNIEVTKCGRVKRVNVNWSKFNKKVGEIFFDKSKKENDEYRCIGIQRKGLYSKPIRVHQLIASAFLGYKFGGHKFVVDHIDSNKLNNHVDNLRVVTQRENLSKERSLKKRLPTGVSYFKRDSKYLSTIRINGKQTFLGMFKTIEEASKAYQQKLKSLN